MNKAALFSLTALVAIACAAPTTSDEPTYGDGDGDNGSGNAPGSGGVVTTTGAGGAPIAGAGGTPIAGAGGTPIAGAGGTPIAGAGGTPIAGAGGAPAVGATCSAAAWTANNGYADNGKMCGFAWTSGWDGAVVDPPCGTAGPCFETQGAELCANGTIPAEADPMYPGMMIGWNAAQNAEGGANATWTSSGTGLTASFTATGAMGATRVVIQSAGTDYCAAATSGTPIPWASFTVGCWTPGGAAFSAGMPITAVAVQVNSAATAQTVDLCVTGIAAN